MKKQRGYFELIKSCLICSLIFVGVVFGVFGRGWAVELNSSVSSTWSAPTEMTIKRVSPIDSSQREPNLLNNLDCTLITYKSSTSDELQTGCFIETAFGLLDSDTSILIPTGSDEGVPLLADSAHQVLVPWPEALNLIALDSSGDNGSSISLYYNPITASVNNRSSLAKIVSKELVRPPDITLRDAAGKPLLINVQDMAFSDNGSWLIVDQVGGSFMRINLASLDESIFAPSFATQGSPALLKSQVAVSQDGQFVVINNAASQSFKVYDLGLCSSSVISSPGRSCQSYDYWSFARRQIPGLQLIKHVRFINSNLISFEAQSSDPSRNGIYELAPTDHITSLIDYLGLGDSFTSGEGAFDYIAGTDNGDNQCHLAHQSYPLMLARDLFNSSSGHSVACSGAVINDVGSISNNYRGQVRGVASFDQLQREQKGLLDSVMTNYLPGYIAQQRFVSQYQPSIISVSVGGDDIGFGDIVQNCVIPHISLHASDETCFNTYEDRLELTNLMDRTVSKWIALYKQLQRQAPGSRLYIIGYPQLAYDKGNCALNAHLGKSELEFSEEIIDYLNARVKQAADSAGAYYVDISQALVGHRLCEATSSEVAVNGLTAGKDAGLGSLKVLGKESYHPNALGQALIEQAILQQTNNLRAVPTNKPANNPTAILNAPKTGRKVASKQPAKITDQVVKRSQVIKVKIAGSALGLKPNGNYEVHLDGSGGQIIGSLASDSSSAITGDVDMPSNVPAGSHTIDVTGDDLLDAPVDISQPIYVPVSDNDADGDGVNNSTDSCPYAINSGQDVDNDGTDDTCDGFIGQSSSNPNGRLGSGTGSTNSPPLGNGSIKVTTSPKMLAKSSGKKVNIPGKFAAINNTVRASKSKAQIRRTASQSASYLGTSFHTNWRLWLMLLLVLWIMLILLSLVVLRLSSIYQEKTYYYRN